MAANNLITLTLKDSSSTVIEINTGDLISLVGSSSDADSIVTAVYKGQNQNLLVDETPTQVVALTNDLISLTLVSDSTVTFFANAARVRRVTVDGTGSDVFLDDNTSAWEILNVTQSQTAVKALVAAAAATDESSVPLGTAGTNVSQVQTGSDRDVTVVLTLNSVAYTIAGAAAEGVGALLYTFPSGAHVHTATFMNVALQGTGTVDADTPDVGVGSIIATGAVSVLSGTPTFEDYITGQTATDVNGTATVVTTVATAGALTGISINESGDVKTLHLNLADTWAGADTIAATGTVTLIFTKVN